MTGSNARRIRRVTVLLASIALAAAGTLAAPAAAGALEHRHPKYVALGDSYASGEGLPPYEEGTHTATNQCHRSEQDSYPTILEDGPRPRFNRLTSVACSGALTGALVADIPDQSDEPAQVAALTPLTKTVTVTIGGNDAGFAPALVDCIYSPVQLPEVQQQIPGRPNCEGRLDGAVSPMIARLAGTVDQPVAGPSLSIVQVLAAVQARAPRATVYVSGYPHLLGAAVDGPAGCQVGQLGQVPLFITADDAEWIAEKAADLNAAIRTGVAQARKLGIRARYVDVAAEFKGHNVCDTKAPWLNAVVLAETTSVQVDPSSFHPTTRGQQAYADAFGGVVQRP